MSVLAVNDLSVRYGPVEAVRSASLSVEEAELVVVIGANGAGKSSLMGGISGLVRSRGSVRLDGRAVEGQGTERRVRHGMCLVPEGRHIFGRMSVLENLQIALWGSGRSPKTEFERIYSLFPVLRDRNHQAAATLSGGEQQMLAVSRALVRHPRLLMLDEPSMGLAPLVVQEMFSLIREINRQGTSVLLVEQNARMALSIAHRGYLMETGRLGSPQAADAMLDDASLYEAYFGGTAPSPSPTHEQGTHE